MLFQYVASYAYGGCRKQQGAIQVLSQTRDRIVPI